MDKYTKCYFCEEFAKQGNLVEVITIDIVPERVVRVCSLCKRLADERSKK